MRLDEWKIFTSSSTEFFKILKVTPENHSPRQNTAPVVVTEAIKQVTNNLKVIVTLNFKKCHNCSLFWQVEPNRSFIQPLTLTSSLFAAVFLSIDVLKEDVEQLLVSIREFEFPEKQKKLAISG